MVILDNDCQSKFREHFVQSWGLGGLCGAVELHLVLQMRTILQMGQNGKTVASGIFRSNWLCSNVGTKE